MSMRNAPFLYRWGRLLVAAALRTAIGRMHVVGLEHVPRTGPFILVSNHESVLDPLFIQVACPRPVHTMAKSTQFAAPGMKWIMPRVLTFPVRRYQVDPQAVRYALRRLDDGAAVGIYLEGERTWDGLLQPPRRGTLRLILRAGVPVVPAHIEGTYGIWPRWARRPRRGSVRVAFSEPIRYPAIRDRARREELLSEIGTRLTERLGGRAGAASGEAPSPL